MTKPTPNRYQVTDYKSPTDPRRMALLRDSIVDRNLTVVFEDEARDLIAQLTAWLDEIDNSGDEPLCRKCVAEAQEAFKSQPMRCKDEPCGWTGTGADLIVAGSLDGNDSPHECPKCCGWTVYEADDTTGGGQ